jgi:hypothetical protein
MAKQPPKGYSAKAYQKQVSKNVKKFVKNSTEQNLNGFQAKDMRSSSEWTTRTLNAGKSAPKEMVYGASNKTGTGATIYKKKAKGK